MISLWCWFMWLWYCYCYYDGFWFWEMGVRIGLMVEIGFYWLLNFDIYVLVVLNLKGWN